MTPPIATATLSAVLATLARATADARIPVVLRTRRTEQARELARWLSAVHGSQRTVIASPSARGDIEVRLPARFPWPAAVHEEMMNTLAANGTGAQYSAMPQFSSRAGPR